MRAVILGCGQMGAELATRLAAAGVECVVLDRDEDSFRQLPPEFAGRTVQGEGTDEDALRQAGVEQAGVFVVATAEDNYNLMVAQLVHQRFKVPRIIVRVYDTEKAALFEGLGLRTYCPTKETAVVMERMIVPGAS